MLCTSSILLVFIYLLMVLNSYVTKNYVEVLRKYKLNSELTSILFFHLISGCWNPLYTSSEMCDCGYASRWKQPEDICFYWRSGPLWWTLRHTRASFIWGSQHCVSLRFSQSNIFCKQIYVLSELLFFYLGPCNLLI